MVIAATNHSEVNEEVRLSVPNMCYLIMQNKLN